LDLLRVKRIVKRRFKSFFAGLPEVKTITGVNWRWGTKV